MSKKVPNELIHGFIDPYAPGGVEALIEFNRTKFGNAVMSAAASGDSGAGSAGNGSSDKGNGAGETSGAAPGSGQGNAGSSDSGSSGDGETLGAPGIKALEAERDNVKQLKAQLADREAKIKAFEDAGKSDEERREQELKELRDGRTSDATKLASTELTVMQYQVAAAAGLDLSAAERLRGTTKEELEADAKEWISKWGSSAGNGVVPGVGSSGTKDEDVAPGMARMRLGYAQSTTKK